MSWVSDILTWFAPGLAVRRAQARAAISMLDERTRKYAASANTNRTKDWRTSNSSMNAELRSSLDKIRSRSRDMYANNGHLRSAINRLTTNMVGSGIRPSVYTESRALEKKLMTAWRDWAESETSDYDGRIDFYAMQSLVVRSVIMSGEAIIRRRRDEASGIPLQVQVQEADVLDASMDGVATEGGGYIVLGVEFNSKGKRVAYWLYDEHPGDTGIRAGLTSRRVAASDVCHVYFIERPGQVRGIPWTTASILKLRDLDQYEDAQIIRQKIAACFTAFVHDASADASLPGDGDGIEYDRLEPGRIEELPIGKSITFSSPPPAEGYDSFTKGVLRSAASGIGITYEAMTNDYSMVNFSSGRMGWIEMARQITEWQGAMVKPFCNTVWAWFTESAAIAGKIRSTQAQTMAGWTPPKREMIDPEKEARGIVEQLKAGLLSYSEALRKQGYEPSDVMEEMASDISKLDDLGIVPSWDGRIEKKSNAADGGNPSTQSDGGNDTNA